MTSQVPEFVLAFNEIAKEAGIFLCITRDSGLQREMCVKLESTLAAIQEEKRSAVSSGSEDYANLLLGCQCVTSSLIAEIKMWLLLKGDRPDEAWDQLIAAQMASVNAARAHDMFAHLQRRVQRLEVIEALVFPSQVFVSSGIMVGFQQCSICGEEYEDCPHLVGKPYMGEFCCIIVGEISLDHVAFVERPADKRCRATGVSVDGGIRNRMTWRVEPRTK